MSIRVQSITFSKLYFPKRSFAEAWLRERGHSTAVHTEDSVSYC